MPELIRHLKNILILLFIIAETQLLFKLKKLPFQEALKN